ncbi:MAG TPA: T9SS type A sorting domain-containing protein [Chitinophagales bacterium]|nr:T9SS type A sorting domain-containing protein [Chitinophagales bacterium]
MKKITITSIFITISIVCDCQTWLPLDGGISWQGDIVSSTAYGILGDTVNHVLYADGYFDTAGNVYAYKCAKWDGATWSAMSTQDEGHANFLIFNGELYLAGDQVQKWNGSDWDLVDPYFNEPGASLIEYNGQLVAGGGFTSAGAVSVKGLAVLDSDNLWQAFPVGGVTNSGGYSPPYISRMAIYNGDLIVGGDFDSAGGVACNSIARWDGNQWHSLGNGVTSSGPVANVLALGVYLDTLYVAGSFDTAGEAYCLDFAKWDGMQWHAVDNPTNFFPKSFKVHNGFLYAGGTSVGNAYKIRRFDGQVWTNLTNSFTGTVFSIDILDDVLYAGGSFILFTPNDTIHNIAMLDIVTGEWRPLPKVGIGIFPNPANDKITIKLESQPYLREVNIINSLGSTVMVKTFRSKSQETIDIRNLASGIYFIKFGYGEVRKFVKE